MKQLHFAGLEPFLVRVTKPKPLRQRIARYFWPVVADLTIAAASVAGIYSWSLIVKIEKNLQMAEKALDRGEQMRTITNKRIKELGNAIDELELIDATIRKRSGISEFSEEDKEAINEALLEIFKMPIEDISLSYGHYETVFTLFDWVRGNIEYIAGTIDDRIVLSPAEVLYYKRGDCDEQAILLSGMINTVLAGSTRFISTIPDSDGVRHGYIQFYVGELELYDRIREEVANAIQNHYGIIFPPAYLNGFDLDLDGLWLTLDTTTSYPARSCRTILGCKPSSVFYQW